MSNCVYQLYINLGFWTEEGAETRDSEGRKAIVFKALIKILSTKLGLLIPCLFGFIYTFQGT
jgi:hypothetical protein